jgi:RNA polymerase sigma factor (sigma-70 family)
MQATMARTERSEAMPRTGESFREINEPEFLEALRSGPSRSPKAFRRLVEITHPHLSRYVGRYFSCEDQVQDVLQETYLAVHRALPRFQGLSRLSTWVYSLAYHKVCDRLSEKYRDGYPQAGVEAEGWDLEIRETPVDERLHQSRLLQWIRAAAAEIPLHYREAYRLRDLEGLSGEEAAAALGISITLIRVRLHRARCLIVERIRERHPSAFAEGALL